jgi:hypothetical protein
LNEARHLQHFPNTVLLDYMDLWDYYILLIFMMQRNCV